MSTTGCQPVIRVANAQAVILIWQPAEKVLYCEREA
jgi:hypothetical protein